MEDFDYFAKHINQCETRRNKYVLPNLPKITKRNQQTIDDNCAAFPVLCEAQLFTEPLECTWSFMRQEEIEGLLRYESMNFVKSAIAKKLNHGFPKGLGRIVTIELLYNAFKFARTAGFNPLQTAALLSIFYMTQRFFTSNHLATPEDAYWYFRELLSYHSLEFVPSHTLVYKPDEAQCVLGYSCKLFLRHLPLIRLVSLPNYELALNTTVPFSPLNKPKESVIPDKVKVQKKNKKEPKK